MGTPKNKRQKREDYRKTHQENQSSELPKKRFYRQRAHANPFSDHQLEYPRNPAAMDWSTHYPAFAEPDLEEQVPRESTMAADYKNDSSRQMRKMRKEVTVADIGCGFGGLLVALAPKLPDELLLGLEIRNQVTAYVHDRIAALRAQHPPSYTSPSDLSDLRTLSRLPSASDTFQVATQPSLYQNISVLRANSMKFLPNFFHRHQLSRLFLCFPDPHFKNRKKKARIVSTTLCSEYAYVVKPGGHVFTITDVEELGAWMKAAFEGHGLWQEVKVDGDANENPEKQKGEEVQDNDKEKEDVAMCVSIMSQETEESKKVTRVGGKKFIGVWRRKEDPPWPQ